MSFKIFRGGHHYDRECVLVLLPDSGRTFYSFANVITQDSLEADGFANYRIDTGTYTESADDEHNTQQSVITFDFKESWDEGGVPRDLGGDGPNAKGNPKKLDLHNIKCTVLPTATASKTTEPERILGFPFCSYDEDVHFETAEGKNEPTVLRQSTIWCGEDSSKNSQNNNGVNNSVDCPAAVVMYDVAHQLRGAESVALMLLTRLGFGVEGSTTTAAAANLSEAALCNVTVISIQKEHHQCTRLYMKLAAFTDECACGVLRMFVTLGYSRHIQGTPRGILEPLVAAVCRVCKSNSNSKDDDESSNATKKEADGKYTQLNAITKMMLDIHHRWALAPLCSAGARLFDPQQPQEELLKLFIEALRDPRPELLADLLAAGVSPVAALEHYGTVNGAEKLELFLQDDLLRPHVFYESDEDGERMFDCFVQLINNDKYKHELQGKFAFFTHIVGRVVDSVTYPSYNAHVPEQFKTALFLNENGPMHRILEMCSKEQERCSNSSNNKDVNIFFDARCKQRMRWDMMRRAMRQCIAFKEAKFPGGELVEVNNAFRLMSLLLRQPNANEHADHVIDITEQSYTFGNDGICALTNLGGSVPREAGQEWMSALKEFIGRVREDINKSKRKTAE